MSSPLKFRDDGTFKIVQFTDMHWQNEDEEDQMTKALMEQVLEAEKPDFVAFTGDIIYGLGCPDPLEALRQAVEPVVSRGIPWAGVLGNHDAERGTKANREEVLQGLIAIEGSLTRHTPGISGFGNYEIAVQGRDGSTASVLYFLDTGDYSHISSVVPGYSWLRHDQIDWYRKTSKSYTENNGGTPLPSLAFFHIPLPEHDEVWQKGGCRGQRHEDVCCGKVNSGFFAAMAEAGDVTGVFTGHDHVNDYAGTLFGITLSYGRATGYHTYGKEGFPRGARIIQLTEGQRNYDSWLRLDDGTVDLQELQEEKESSLSEA
ncbi:metallophosphoesterase family protein [Paenibacillus pasadenensis]|uniref:metallophosphoesterase family protein n=1 Tax=Paenibacillus pasadenensis TaxID=217090 RepID=UPI002040DA2F|nr:metallophosphoesterase family protein [Paenibacillus pasadenensis]MCM3749246.1 metallophosphoesterase family protein [Paenibacillus pasadenensis]